MAEPARRKRKDAERFVDPDAAAAILDEETVLQHLEAGRPDDDDDRLLRGLRNGVLIGAFIWLIVLGIILLF